jgi:hypothetical protein
MPALKITPPYLNFHPLNARGERPASQTDKGRKPDHVLSSNEGSPLRDLTKHILKPKKDAHEN